jgi:quercetin dioxygenase-like cupin family protein
MGYVFKGRMRFTHVDGTEQVVGPGEAYYVPPGHRWTCLEDTEIVEFSPTDELARHMEAVARNLERVSEARLSE